MRHIVVGTAGHIDHGKTSLVRALTGIDTDRLKEEKRRGISIDLGFAHLQLAEDLRIAFIDVPGHEKFVKNMLAGVGGIDLVMMVIAADESIKPQTREHFEICRLLRIRHGVIALTKADLVEEDIAGLVKLEAEELVRDSFLSGAPVIPVSAVTGTGLDEMKRSLKTLSCQVPSRNTSRPFRMPVDRSFVMQGFGVVATGTVVTGAAALDEELQVHPFGPRVRVRGIEVHGNATKKVTAGQRAAINVSGIETGELKRGGVLSKAGSYQATAKIDCLFELLPSARPLKNRAPVHFHTGTAETVAEVRIQDGGAFIEPGSTVPVRIVLRDPLLAAPDDRFIVRLFSPLVTIGGGEIIDTQPPLRPRAGRTRRLAAASIAGRISLYLQESRAGLPLSEIAMRMGLTPSEVTKNLGPDVWFLPEPQPWLMDREWVSATAHRWKRLLAEFHQEQPLLPGLRREELRSRELPDTPPFVFDALIASEPAIAGSGEILHLQTHQLALKQDEERAFAHIETAFARAGLAVPGVQEVLSASGVDEKRARSLLQILLRNRRLVKVSGDLVFHPDAIAELHRILSVQKGKLFSVTDFKSWTGVSRKYAIPLLEFLDRERLTRREGDRRLVL